MDTSIVDIENQPEVIVKTPMKPTFIGEFIPNAVGIMELAATGEPIMVTASEPVMNEIAAPIICAVEQAPVAPAAGIMQIPAEIEGIHDTPQVPEPMQPEDIIRYGVPNTLKCETMEVDPNAPNCGGYIITTLISCLCGCDGCLQNLYLGNIFCCLLRCPCFICLYPCHLLIFIVLALATYYICYALVVILILIVSIPMNMLCCFGIFFVILLLPVMFFFLVLPCNCCGCLTIPHLEICCVPCSCCIWMAIWTCVYCCTVVPFCLIGACIGPCCCAKCWDILDIILAPCCVACFNCKGRQLKRKVKDILADKATPGCHKVPKPVPKQKVEEVKKTEEEPIEKQMREDEEIVPIKKQIEEDEELVPIKKEETAAVSEEVKKPSDELKMEGELEDLEQTNQQNQNDDDDEFEQKAETPKETPI